MCKKLLFAAVLSASLIGCIPQRTFFSTFSSGIDYKEYSDLGFYVTESNSVNFNYTPISSIVASVKSGYLGDEKPSNSKVKVSKSDRGSLFITATASIVLEELYQEAIKLGANGIINLKIEAKTESGINDYGVTTDFPVYVATGMAIKK